VPLLMRCLLPVVHAPAAAHMAWLQLSVSQNGSGCILSLMLLASVMSSICSATDSASKHQGVPAQMRLLSQTQPLLLSSTARSLFTMKEPCGFAGPHTPLQQADAQSVAPRCVHAVYCCCTTMCARATE
jgi:hypothetical protein